ncbi:MAG: class I SAM-dependent methyltransferase [Acidobacteriota bacterium]
MDAEHPLEQAVREIRERVQARHPQGAHGRFAIPVADLLPLLHARDAAEAKVAAIGTVNPRPPGLKNSLIQSWKRLLARLLDWHVREQVEFNRGAVNATQATLEALNEHNRALRDIALALEDNARRMDAVESRLAAAESAFSNIDGLREQARELADVRLHWHAWRQEWERKLSVNEVQFLRGVADLNGAYQHRTAQLEANFRDIVSRQHRDFEGLVARSNEATQARFWADFAKVREEYERLIHAELRTIRQKAFAAAAHPPPAAPEPPAYDFIHFANRFRGPEAYVRANYAAYLPLFAGRQNIVDLGCGRGEFLALLAENGLTATGVDGDAESVGICLSKGLTAVEADLFAWLEAQPDHSLDGVFCGQVIEHLPPPLVPRLFSLCAAKSRPGAVAVFETPNPECLAIFASHFYLDPTHQRPVPPALAAHYLEEAGYGRLEIRRLAPAIDSMPSLAALPAEFREAFFGCLDYAAIGTRL